MLELNQESSVAQNTLTRANVNLKQREVQILEASLTDALTGVGNRRKLEQALATEISRVRHDGSALSAIMTDVDHFKRVNDEYGHGVGDKVPVQLGALLRSQTRQTDIVARFGGEEFIVLMPHTSLAQAAAKAENLRGALAAELIEPLARPVTASFGVAELSGEEDGESFLGRVDKALYRAKEGGRNQVVAANSVQ
jgi:diguanylate cyclase (GGDEF)-like protein